MMRTFLPTRGQECPLHLAAGQECPDKLTTIQRDRYALAIWKFEYTTSVLSLALIPTLPLAYVASVVSPT